tara:strand:+ start:319 stop:747 length:429 start_codon:yes stop_codon:yes gene_type:complete
MVTDGNQFKKGKMLMTTQIKNSIFEIHPYWNGGTWVFDDDSVGLVREPFVAGMPEILDSMVKNIKNAEKGFRLIFSATPFPEAYKLIKIREEIGGNWYRTENKPYREGWLCPALANYFPEAPNDIYAKAEELPKGNPWWRVW